VGVIVLRERSKLIEKKKIKKESLFLYSQMRKKEEEGWGLGKTATGCVQR
jgi:hypothetical protein